MTFKPNVKPAAGSLKFLIVDDNRQMREMLRSYLFDVASEIRECEDGADALDCYKEFLPDRVLMDWELPEMVGATAIRLIVSHYPQAKIFIVTAFDEESLRGEAIRAGAVGFMLNDNLFELEECSKTHPNIPPKTKESNKTMKNKNENTNAKQTATATGRQAAIRSWLMIFALLLTVFFGQALTAQAAVFTVDTTADNAALTACTAAPNDCSIGGAIANSNANGQADTINFDQTVFGAHQTINLNDGFAVLADGKLTISGPAAGVTLSLANSNVFPRRVFSLFGSAPNLEINNLTLTGGNTFQGGAIYSEGTVTINNSTITGNTTTETGGGLTNRVGMLTITNSTVSNNSSPFGGGIFNSNNGTVTITNSTINNNLANFGGGVFSNFLGSTVMMTNSTVSGNSGVFRGGGIWSFGIFQITNSTVSNNSSAWGGGVHQANGAFRPGSTIFADNTSPDGPDYAGFAFSLGYNLFETPPTTGGNSPTDLIGVDPLLGPLQNNGGPTRTHALMPGSPAIDKGNSFGTNTDQRGAPRPFDDPNISNAPGGDGSDIGSFELNFRNFSSSQLLRPSQTRYLTGAAAGSDVSVSYSLNGYRGASPYSQPPVSQRIDCATKAPIGAATPIQTYPGDPFYNSRYDFYTTIWRTQSSYAGTCRRLTLYFSDGSTQSFDYQFR